MGKGYVVDTETTGFDAPEVLELAWLAVEEGPLRAADNPGVARFVPSKGCEWGALATHHILPGDLPITGLPASRACLPPGTTHIIGHNVDYDWRALGSPDVQRICTLALARAAWPRLDSHTQGALAYYLFGTTTAVRDRLRNLHSAGADVLLCWDILREALVALEVEPKTLHDLWLVSEDARIPTVMAFGKYKGQPIEKVDRGWISWYRRQDEPDEYLLRAFERLGV